MSSNSPTPVDLDALSEGVARLLEMGFDPERARLALGACEGHVSDAVTLLQALTDVPTSELSQKIQTEFVHQGAKPKRGLRGWTGRRCEMVHLCLGLFILPRLVEGGGGERRKGRIRGIYYRAPS